MNIENKKQFVTMLLAVGLGLMAAFLTSQYVKTSITQETKNLAQDYQGKNKALIQELEATKKNMMQLKKNQDLLAKQMRERPKIVPTQTKGTVVQKKKKIVDQSTFSVITPPGKRALTVEISSLAAVGGLVNPGDYVDIIAHLRIPEGGNTKTKKIENVTSVLFQDIQVLAVGTNYKPVANALTYAAQQKAKKLKVTLALTSEEAALLSFSEENGTLQLSLRSPSEQGKETLQIASWDALADYVQDHQGTELIVPKKVKSKAKISVDEGSFEFEDEEDKPFIQIFRGGQEL